MLNIPQEVYDQIENVVSDGSYEYADNYRAYKVGDEAAAAEFRDAELAGCCGFYTGEVVIAGTTWVIGFNYGH